MPEVYGSREKIRPLIEGRKLVSALDYWESICPPGSYPARKDIDPMAIPKLLPTTFIVEAERDGEFRYQLTGEEIEEKYGFRNARNKTPQELIGADAAEAVLRPYRRVRDERVLFYRDTTLGWVGEPQQYTHYRVILLPLSDDGTTVNMIMGVHEFYRLSEN